LDGVNHRITSSKASDNVKSSLEGLTEHEVRILVQDQFTPINSRQGHHKNLPLEKNIQSGSGLPTTTSSSFLKFHDSTIASMAAGVPIAPTVNLTTAEQLIRQKKVAATSGDIFMTGRD
jgi:hypothetical protein